MTRGNQRDNDRARAAARQAKNAKKTMAHPMETRSPPQSVRQMLWGRNRGLPILKKKENGLKRQQQLPKRRISMLHTYSSLINLRSTKRKKSRRRPRKRRSHRLVETRRIRNRKVSRRVRRLQLLARTPSLLTMPTMPSSSQKIKRKENENEKFTLNQTQLTYWTNNFTIR